MIKEGVIIAERYEIISRIGSGGMADVYKAKDHKLNRLVAVKVLKPEFREDTTFIGKFRKEAQAAAGLSHPNIVNVFDVGEEDGISYIVMELVEGITLKDYITKKGKLSVKEATSIAIQVSLGLEAAHNSNIVHRDVKPQNIIISTDGKVKLSDFGIARAASSNTISSNVMVSVHYSSPEQVRGGYSDKKSDVYSLGVTMYEMVTGRVPFDGDTSVSIAIKHLQEEMIPPAQYTPDLPYSMQQIILKCTQKSIDRRYNNLSEVIDDLKRSLVDPEGNFVTLAPLSNTAQTVAISREDLDAIKDGRSTQESETNPYALQDEGDENDEYDEEYDEEDGDDEDESGISSKLEKAMTIGGFIIGAIIICILIYFIGAAAGIFNFGGSKKDDTAQTEVTPTVTTAPAEEEVTVPSILGKTPEEAQEILNQLGLGMEKVGEEASGEYAKGQIMAQNMESGTKVAKNTTIGYTLSTGESAITVPNIVGQLQADAEAALKDIGLETSITREYSDEVAAGRVISVNPEVGSTVSKGDVISVVVSKGVEGVQVQVPSVGGLSEEQAKSVLERLGLSVVVKTGSSNSVGQGEVISQSITSGTMVDAGTEITITVNREATADEEVPTASNDDDGSDANVTYSGEWTCNSKLEIPSEYSGKSAKLELLQEVNGKVVNRPIVEGIVLSGSEYNLTTTGADGVNTGTVYLYELIDGEYKRLVQYTVPFKQS